MNLTQTLERARERGAKLLREHHLSKQLEEIQQRGGGADAYYRAMLESDGFAGPRLFIYWGKYHIGKATPLEDQPAGLAETKYEVSTRKITDYTLELLYQMLRRELWQRPDEGILVWVCQLIKNGRRRRLLLEPGQLALAGKFKEACLGAGGHFWGEARDVDKIIRELNRQEPPEVRIVTAPGYDAKSGCWLFENVAIDSTGRHHFLTANSEFWSIGGDNLILKGTSSELAIKSNPPAPLDLCWLITQIEGGWGLPGVATLGFFAASLFANQFADKQGWFPFLSMWGPPGPGKTTLIGFLQTCLGRRRTGGWGPTKTSSRSAFQRLLGEVSGLPVVITEFNAKAAEQFGIDSLKEMFNRGPVATRGARTHGTETYAVPFQASAVFEWNEEFFSDAGLASRVASILFPKRETMKTLPFFRALSAEEPGVLADFRRQVLADPPRFLARLLDAGREEAAWLYKRGFVEDNAGERLVQVYGVPMGGVVCLLDLAVENANMSDGAATELRDRLRESMAANAARAARTLSSASTVLELWANQVAADLESGPLVDMTSKNAPEDEIWLRCSDLTSKYTSPAWRMDSLLEESSKKGLLLHSAKAESRYCNPKAENRTPGQYRVFRFRRDTFFPPQKGA